MMKHSGVAALLAGAVLVLGQESWAGRNRATPTTNPGSACQTVAAVTALTAEETADLQYLRQEEKLARDTYQALYAAWGLPLFRNLAVSEQRHVDAVLARLAAYGIADPLPDDAAGTFSDPEIQGLFAALVTAGSQSLVEALRVGAMVEDLDIADLDAALALTDNADLRQVFTNLVRGSESHLRSFVAQLARNGATYTPQFISPARFDAIIGPTVISNRRAVRQRP